MCPSTKTLLALCEGKLKGREHRMTVLHLEDCGYCELLLALCEEEIAESPAIYPQSLEAVLNEVAPE
jgi:hypothetical protein